MTHNTHINCNFWWFFYPKFWKVGMRACPIFHRCSRNIMNSISVNLISCYDKKQQILFFCLEFLDLNFVVFVVAPKKKLRNFFSILYKLFWTDKFFWNTVLTKISGSLFFVLLGGIKTLIFERFTEISRVKK